MLRRAFMFASLVGVVQVGGLGCMREHFEHDGYGGSSIVFGIDQTKNAEGKLTTSVGYEMLDIRNRGWSARGFASADRSCWAERLDDRLGQPRVAGGVATFQGGLLPAGGIAVVANRDGDLTLDGAAWTNAGEALTFESRGFAMPDIPPVQVRVPSLDLAIVSPADAAAEVPVRVDQELEVGWTPSDPAAPYESVVASLIAPLADQPNARGVELRCFFERTAGTGRLPTALLERFATLVGGAPGTAIKGKLRLATHRQLTMFAPGDWTVYVVATAEQREQAFAIQR